jgi:methylthioribose-1-phosphate isomerase
VGGTSGYLEILDQRALPERVEVLQLRDCQGVWEAIRTLAVRGAPAIGVAAGYGMVLAGAVVDGAMTAALMMVRLGQMGEYLKGSRPTAVNLAWAVDRMLAVAEANRGVGARPLQQRLLMEAHAICNEDVAMCEAIGRNGAAMIKPGMGVLTHCNAGNLATAEVAGAGGTALAIMYAAHRSGVKFSVFADETRPLLQGARLTAWELQQAGIDVTVICDNMAGLLMQQGKVGLVIVGADRIAANGDTANKIGTYSVATLAKAHGVRFVVAAPSSTFDLKLADGSAIPIEERAAEEITEGFGRRTVPIGVKVYNPAFDVTPAGLIDAIVTERGVISPVTEGRVREVLGVGEVKS